MSDVKNVLIIGSGALKIGEAGEFDYSGNQALKALHEEGVRTILVNPNIATVQTSPGAADRVYFLPINADFVTEVIARERPDGILLGFGGQTALNCGLELARRGVLDQYGVRVLGTPIAAIEETEDRERFAAFLRARGFSTPRSAAVTSVAAAVQAAEVVGYPVMVRAAYALGGKGSAVARDAATLAAVASRALHGAPQLLIEEYLEGWKEIEYEVVRDAADNCVTVCNMENMDPMGIHTGESIVVAPSQTLTNAEYHELRAVAIRLIRSLGIVGECNVQFALNPKDGTHRIIEVNARLSRSSALASKATGYPLAYIAAKLALGKHLPEITNAMTGVTRACFEPALDYVVVKIPRWDLAKFRGVTRTIGSEMKSVGEVMGIGRTFEEALQKAIRMCAIGAMGLVGHGRTFEDLEGALRTPTDEHLFAIAIALEAGWSSARIAALTHIDPWFIDRMATITHTARALRDAGWPMLPDLLRAAKRCGFSDAEIATCVRVDEETVRRARMADAIVPAVIRIDTLAAEYPARTNYRYCTYGVQRTEHDDGPNTNRREKVLVLGSGPYKIGSSVEFDWCAVAAVRTFRALGYETIMVNCNPETVSTDYDECDRLYFEELTLERVRDICAIEQPMGVCVAMGGQIPNTLALPLARAGIRILGTPATSIHAAEDRHAFSGLLETLGIDQPPWEEASSLASVCAFAARVGYPVLVRPSYVLSGAAMGVAFDERMLRTFLERAYAEVNREHPVVVSKFVSGAKEFEIDAVARGGELLTWALTEHVEHAGVHSGDATVVLPAQEVFRETEDRALAIAKTIARELAITGPFNIQFLGKGGRILVIECNLRASRSFPFVSKALGVNFIELATRAMVGAPIVTTPCVKPERIAVKAPQFSFARLRGSDPVCTVDMRSTGEVACFGESFDEALLKALLAAGFRLPSRNILLSLGGDANKAGFLPAAQELVALGHRCVATPRTAAFFVRYGLHMDIVEKPSSGRSPSVAERLHDGTIDLVINTSDEGFPEHIPDDYAMRRMAVDLEIPLLTNLQLAKRFVVALARLRRGELTLRSEPYDIEVNIEPNRVAATLARVVMQ